MPVFEYVARDGSGTAVRGRAHAEDVRDLASLLRRQGLFLTSAESLALGSGGRVALSPGELANFTHHLAVLLDAGLTVFSALEALEEHAEEESLQRFSRVLREEVERGASLSQALASAAEGLPQGVRGGGPGRRGHRPAGRGPSTASVRTWSASWSSAGGSGRPSRTPRWSWLPPSSWWGYS
jgi:type II secretory pathway component PulF